MDTSKRKLSLFAQSMKAKRNTQDVMDLEAVKSEVTKDSFGDKSVLLTGDDKDSIHDENVGRLSKMSTEEILQEKKKLIEELDPGLIEFLKSRKKNRKEIMISESSTEVENSSTQHLETKLESIPPVVAEIANKWPHMDHLEEDKLKWIEDIQPCDNKKPNVEAYNARFDFEGNLLDYKESVQTEGLYHHGEEPDRPGYTIQELLHLSRSSILQQRMTSINTIANILHKADTNDSFLNSPIKPQLMDSNVYLMLRFSLDDNAHPIINPTLHALQELFVSAPDELCLDRCLSMYKLKQPNFNVNMDELKKEEKEIKDEDYVRLDLVRGSMRTDLLRRLTYVLSQLHPDSVLIRNIVRILIRMARHSSEICGFIIQEEFLMKRLHSLAASVDIYSSCVVKLYRILFSQNINVAKYLLERHDITGQVLSIINNQHQGHIKLVIECLYYLSTLSMYRLNQGQVSAFSPVLLRLLESHFNLTETESSELDLEHASALVYLINILLCQDDSSSGLLKVWLQRCSLKWITQSLKSDLNFSLCCLLGNVLLSLNISQTCDVSLRSFLTSDAFRRGLSNLSTYSWLLNGRVDKGHDCLPQLGSVPMILHKNSIFPLLNSLFLYLKHRKDEALMLFSCDGLLSYVERIVSSNELAATMNHYYASYEINMLVTLLELYHHCQCSTHDELMHSLSLILVSVVQNDQQHLLPPLLRSFVFEEKHFQSSVIREMQRLNISDRETPVTQMLNEAISRLPQIKQYYQTVFNVAPNLNPNIRTLTMSENGTEQLLPCDWVYLPIMKLYDAEVENKSVSRDINPEHITLSLQWILILEYLFPRIVSKNAITARYCRLSCTFLADNELFHTVNHLLHAILKCLLEKPQEFDFSKPVEGLSSFYDFYRELLDQFVGVSYGDQVFGAFILVPLQQKQDKKYKQLLWSEQAAALRFLSTSVDTLGMSIEEFLSPTETDPSLLNTYLFCLATGKIREVWCPVLYTVAIHHVSVFLQIHTETTLAQELLAKVEKLGHQDLKNKILNYISPVSTRNLEPIR